MAGSTPTTMRRRMGGSGTRSTSIDLNVHNAPGRSSMISAFNSWRPSRVPSYLRVIKWLSSTPVVVVYTYCDREFKAPTSALSRTVDAQANLQQQFERHKCQAADAKMKFADLGDVIGYRSDQRTSVVRDRCLKSKSFRDTPIEFPCYRSRYEQSPSMAALGLLTMPKA